MKNLEIMILRNLLLRESFTRKVLPYLKSEYFEGNYKIIFKQICEFVAKYNKLPTKDAFEIELQEGAIPENKFVEISQIIPSIFQDDETDQEWLLEKSEEWCQERAIHNAIFSAIDILDGKNDKLTKHAIPELLTDALSVGFAPHIGHDYFDDAESRYEYYHQEEKRIPFDLEYFNRITKGGLPLKSLFVIMATTGVGKSMAMCHMAASHLSMGYNVLYITMEMSEEKVTERLDANLLDIPISELGNVPRDHFLDRISRIRKKTTGNLVTKEYPTSQANASHFRALMNDLKMKKKFVPDVVYIDYLNICSSSRIRSMGGSVTSYSYIKAIAEEIRGLAVEMDVPIITATQGNRDAFGNSEPDLDNTSESWGLPATADGMVALISSDELESEGKIEVKQLKNRYADLYRPRKFHVGIDRDKMRLFDLDEDDQEYISQGHVPPLPQNDIAKKATEFNFDE